VSLQGFRVQVRRSGVSIVPDIVATTCLAASLGNHRRCTGLWLTGSGSKALKELRVIPRGFGSRLIPGVNEQRA
jgi:hypothetical protein